MPKKLSELNIDVSDVEAQIELKGFRKSEFARLAGISYSSMVDLLNGNHFPHKILPKVAAALGCKATVKIVLTPE